MEKVERESKIYWMRRVELSKVRDTFLLVEKHGGLKYTKISEEGIKEGIFRRKDGAPLAHSPIYHYVNTALRLGLLIKDGTHRYLPNLNNPITASFLKLNRFLKPLEKEEDLAFQKLIIYNTDCRKAFLWIFLGREDFTWEEFIKFGSPVFISPVIISNKKKIRSKKYENKITQAQFILKTKRENFALEWGLQLWAKECLLIDEVYIDERRHLIYPLDSTNTIKFEDSLKEFQRKYQPSPSNEWSFFPIDLLIFDLAPLLKVSVREMRDNFFLEARRRMPDQIKFSGSSKGALTFRRRGGRRADRKLLESFIKIDNVWMTHILVHKKLWEMT